MTFACVCDACAFEDSPAQVPGMYAFITDGYYLDPRNIRFAPFFHATF